MTKIFARFLKDESGATAIEYGLIAALISVAIIAGASTLGDVQHAQRRNDQRQQRALIADTGGVSRRICPGTAFHTEAVLVF